MYFNSERICYLNEYEYISNDNVIRSQTLKYTSIKEYFFKIKVITP